MSETNEIMWLVMRIRRWDNLSAGVRDAGLNLLVPPYLGFGFVCAFKSQAEAEAACEEGDTVAAVGGAFIEAEAAA